MRSNETTRKRWSEEDRSRLRSLHEEQPAEAKAKDFKEKLARRFDPDRTIESVDEECRRLALNPKRLPRSVNCVSEQCKTPGGLLLNKENRVGDLCRKCYSKQWFVNNMRN